MPRHATRFFEFHDSTDTDNDDDDHLSPMLRCTRSKTLPSALRRSRSKQNVKRVRFADSLGLDLENRQYFVNEDHSHHHHHRARPNFSLSYPIFPAQTSASITNNNNNNNQLPRLAVSNFFYRSPHEYNDRTRNSRVCVTALRASGNSIVGQVNLLNLAFDKTVVIRFTTDNWSSQDEVIANYSHRMFSTDDIDAFNFTIQVPVKVLSGKCEFCVQYNSNGEEWWDNNSGTNYIIDICSPTDATSPLSSILPKFGTMSMSSTNQKGSRGHVGTLPAVPCSRTSQRRQQRRWGKSLDESDDELSYLPTRRFS